MTGRGKDLVRAPHHILFFVSVPKVYTDLRIGPKRVNDRYIGVSFTRVSI